MQTTWKGQGSRTAKTHSQERAREKIKARLLARRREILDHMNSVSPWSSKEMPPEPGDLGDCGNASIGIDTALGILESETSELREVDAALERIEEGTYGICEVCGRRISKARLRAKPYATHCLACQVILDKNRARG